MTYEEIVEQVRKTLAKADAASVKEHAALQVNIRGEGEGAFYIEVQPGQITVEPYEYFDRDILITAEAAPLMEVVNGQIDIINANLTGKIVAEGDLRKAEVFKELRTSVGNTAKKAAAKKEPAKKATAKKTAAKKTAAKKEPAKKAAPKKAPAKKADTSDK